MILWQNLARGSVLSQRHRELRDTEKKITNEKWKMINDKWVLPVVTSLADDSWRTRDLPPNCRQRVKVFRETACPERGERDLGQDR